MNNVFLRLFLSIPTYIKKHKEEQLYLIAEDLRAFILFVF